MGISILSGGASPYPHAAPRRAVMLTLGLGGLCVAASLALALPPLLPTPQNGPLALHEAMLLALLGLAGGALALFTGSAAAYLTQAAAARAVQTIAAAAARASEQVGALDETAERLHRHAAALDSAGCEIARAGAGWISRMGETVGHAEAALRQLPEAAAAIAQAAERTGQTLSEAATRFGLDAAALHGFGRDSTRAAAALQQDAVALGAMLGRVGQEMTGAAEAVATRLEAVMAGDGMAALARLPLLADGLAAAADRLDAGAGLHQAAAATASAAITQAATAAIAETGAAAQHLAGLAAAAEARLQQLAETPHPTPEPLPDWSALGDTVAALRQAGQAMLDSGETVAGRLASGVSGLEAAAAATAEAVRHGEATLRQAAGQAVAGWPDLAAGVERAAEAAERQTLAMAEAGRKVTLAAETLAGGLGGAVAGLETALQAMPGRTAAATADAVAELEAALADRGAALQASLDTTGQETRHAAATLQQAATLLLAAGHETARHGDDAVARLAQTAADLVTTVATAANAAEVAAGETRASLASLPPMLAAAAAELATSLGRDLAAPLRTELACLQVGWERQAQDLAAVGDAVGRAAGHAEAALQQVGDVAAGVAREVGGVAERAASRLAAAVPAVLDAAGQATQSIAEAAGTLSAQAGRLDAATATLLARLDHIRRDDAPAHADLLPSGLLPDGLLPAGLLPDDSLPEDRPAAGGATATVLAGTLHQLGHVERAASGLLRRTEWLAEAVLAGQAPDAPAALARRTPTLLHAIEGSIQQLRAAATALALASDGPRAPPCAAA